MVMLLGPLPESPTLEELADIEEMQGIRSAHRVHEDYRRYLAVWRSAYQYLTLRQRLVHALRGEVEVPFTILTIGSREYWGCYDPASGRPLARRHLYIDVLADRPQDFYGPDDCGEGDDPQEIIDDHRLQQQIWDRAYALLGRWQRLVHSWSGAVAIDFRVQLAGPRSEWGLWDADGHRLDHQAGATDWTLPYRPRLDELGVS